MSNEPLRRFSHSLVDCYLDCPRKAYYRYVENVASPKSAALVKGTACDNAWNYDLEQKMETKADIALNDLLEITEQAFRDDVTEQGGVDSVDWGDSNARAELESAIRLSRTWHMQLAPDIQPMAVQVRYTRTLESGREVIGFVDCEATVDGAIAVLDNKTASRRMVQGDADKALQASAYSWLKGEPIDFVFARAIDTGKSQAAEFVWTRRGSADNEHYGELLTDVERAWEAGIFPTNPKSVLCSKKYCAYWERCPVGRGQTAR